MAVNNETLNKELNKNYGEVQKKILKFEENKKDVQKTFNQNTKSLEGTLKKELNVIKTDIKEIQKSYKQQLNDKNEQFKNFQVDLKAKRKHETDSTENLIKKLDDEFKKKEAKIDENLAKSSKEFAQNNTKLEKEFEQNSNRSTSDKEEVVKKAEKEISDLDEKFAKADLKFNEKVENLNLKKNDKIQKTKDTYLEKVQKLEQSLKLEEEKNKKWKEERHPLYLAGLSEIEKEIENELKIYEEKHSAIQSTMESRVARREKFVNRAQTEGDSKAVKAQNKEIKKIKTDAEKELKILNKKHSSDSSELAIKKKTYMEEYLNEIAEVDRKYVDFVEKRKYDLEKLKINEYKDIAEVDVDFRTKINSESKKHSDFFEEIESKKANIMDTRDRKILQLENQLSESKIVFDQEKETLLIENEKLKKSAIELHKINAIELSKDKELTRIELEKLLAKFDFDEKVRNERHDKDLLILIEEEAIENHKKELERQLSVSKEYKLFQDEVTQLYSLRAKEMYDYEEKESSNRYKLKLQFLETQLELVRKDIEKAVTKINQRFDEEIVSYNILIEEGTKGELEEILLYEEKKNEEIAKETEKRNTLNPRAYKKQIRDLDQKIDQMKKQLVQDVAARKSELESRIQIFKDQVKLAETRRDLALNEVSDFLKREETQLEKSIELLKTQLDNELKDMESRFENTSNNAKLYDEQSKQRFEMVENENTLYMESRVKKQKDAIHSYEAEFDARRNEFDNEYQEQLAVLKNNQQFAIDESVEKIKTVKDAIKVIEEEASKSNNQVLDLRRQKELELQENFVKQSSRLDVKDKNHRTSIHNAMYERTTILDTSNKQIDTDVQEMKLKVETDLKQQKKNFDAVLAKEMAAIESRLKQDLQTL